jgi:hypothetical protein
MLQMKIPALAPAVRLLLLVCGAVPADLQALERLEPEAGCYLGAYLGVNRPGQEVATPVDSFLAKAEKEHAIYHRFIAYGDTFPRTWAESVAALGSACLVSYGLPESTAMDTLLNVGDARFMRFVNAMRAFGGPVFVRIGHEMNGPWSGWGQCSTHYIPAFKRAARVIHDSVPLAAAVWCPNYGGGYPWGGRNEGDAYTAYYPYDDSVSYVDWVGLDFFHCEFWSNQYTPLDTILGRPPESSVHFYRYFCGSLHKPMMFCETSTLERDTVGGLHGSNRLGVIQRWWIAALYDAANLRQRLPKLKGLVWFHVLKREDMSGNIWCDWRITDSSFTLYREQVSDSYFLSFPSAVGCRTESTAQWPGHLFFATPSTRRTLQAYCSMRPFEAAVICVLDAAGRELARRPVRANSSGTAFAELPAAGPSNAGAGVRFISLIRRDSRETVKLCALRK